MSSVLPYQNKSASPNTSAKGIALGLLLAINLFNYIDRNVLAAVVPKIEEQFFGSQRSPAVQTLLKWNDSPEFWMGLLATAFIVSYMITAPIFGWLADRMNRWIIIGFSVLIWSLATGASGVTGLLGGFALLFITRLFVGIGEGGYGPAAPTLLSDYFSVNRRGIVLSCFYLAIPVGSALGFALGGMIAERYGWPTAFYAVVGPGLIMGLACFFMKDPPRGVSDHGITRGAPRRASRADYMVLLQTPSYLLDSLGMTAMTFAIGGIGFWMPKFLFDQNKFGTLGRVNMIFGGITVVAGFFATLLGGLTGDLVKRWLPSAYFLVSGIAIVIACPFVLLMVHAEAPWVWVYLFIAVFFLFFNTGPTNAILANVTHPSVRATAFAVNILIIHALGDAASPPILGKIGHASWDRAFGLVAIMMAIAGILWLWGCRYLKRDTELAPTRLDFAAVPAVPVITTGSPDKPHA